MSSIKKIILFVVLAVILIILAFQLFFVPFMNLGEADGESFDGTYESLTAIADGSVDLEDDGSYKVSFPDILPSKDPADYMSVYMNFSVTNLSFIQAYSISADVESMECYKDNILEVTPSDSILPTYVNRFEKTSAYLIVDIYIGNLTEDQIVELIKGLKIKLTSYGNLFGTKVKTEKITDSDQIKLKFYEK